MENIVIAAIGMTIAYGIHRRMSSDRVSKVQGKPLPRYPYQSHRVAHQQEYREQWVATEEETDHVLGLPKQYRIKHNGVKVPVYGKV